jgi:hypothetical protein
MNENEDEINESEMAELMADRISSFQEAPCKCGIPMCEGHEDLGGRIIRVDPLLAELFWKRHEQ